MSTCLSALVTVCNVGISIVAQQEYHPLFSSLAFEVTWNMVLSRSSVPSTTFLSVVFRLELREGPLLLKYQVIHLGFCSGVVKLHFKVRGEPSGTVTGPVLFLSNVTKSWPEASIATTATTNRKDRWTEDRKYNTCQLIQSCSSCLQLISFETHTIICQIFKWH